MGFPLQITLGLSLILCSSCLQISNVHVQNGANNNTKNISTDIINNRDLNKIEKTDDDAKQIVLGNLQTNSTTTTTTTEKNINSILKDEQSVTHASYNVTNKGRSINNSKSNGSSEIINNRDINKIQKTEDTSKSTNSKENATEGDEIPEKNTLKKQVDSSEEKFDLNKFIPDDEFRNKNFEDFESFHETTPNIANNANFEIQDQLTTPISPLFDKKFKETVEKIHQNLEQNENFDTYTSEEIDQIEDPAKNSNNTKLQLKEITTVLHNNTDNKNSKHKNVDVEQIKHVNFENFFNDTKVYDTTEKLPNSAEEISQEITTTIKNVEPTIKTTATTTTTSTTTSIPTTIKNSIIFRKINPNKNNNTDIIDNKIEKEKIIKTTTTTTPPVDITTTKQHKEQLVEENKVVSVVVTSPRDIFETTIVLEETTRPVVVTTTTGDVETTTKNVETTTDSLQTTTNVLETTTINRNDDTTTFNSVSTENSNIETTTVAGDLTTITTETETRISKAMGDVELTTTRESIQSDQTTSPELETTTTEAVATTEKIFETTTPTTEEMETTTATKVVDDITTVEITTAKKIIVTTTTEKTDVTTEQIPTTEYRFIHIKSVDVNHTTLQPETLKPSFGYNAANSTNVDDDIATTTTQDPTTDPVTSNGDGGGGINKGTIAAIVISSVGGVCLVILAGLLYIMRKRQKRFNYGQRCRPVTLDDYSMDNVSVYNSMRRKTQRLSKRSYGNPAFEDPVVSHPLNLHALTKFANNFEDIKAEFEEIPQIAARNSELPEGCDEKNRYANVIPLPETRVYLQLIENYVNSDYINANYVTGPKDVKGYYIATQAPMENTVDDFWRMVWEQQSKVILMLTHLFENGVEKSVDYLPPSEVTDCHRLFGDFQVTLKKREVKEKYIISSIQLKNMVSNSWRDVTHFWYLGWPEKGVPSEANSIIAFLIEARSYMKSSTLDKASADVKQMKNGHAQSESNPVVVHCSPGTGRTGVAITCDIAIREFEQTRLVDVPKIVYKMRRDRAGAVQTKEQYQFIYRVVSLYATKLAGGALDSI